MGPRLLPFTLVFVGCLASLTGCADAPPKTEEDAKTADAPKDEAKDDIKSADKLAAPKADDLNDAQREQMEIALRRGAAKSANCDRVVPGSAVGEGEVRVTFDGKKGRAVDVAVPAPWAGTDAEACIKQAFKNEIIVPFDGQLEVPYPIKVGKKDDAPPPKTPVKGVKKK